MKTTKADSLAVDSTAWRTRSQVSRRLAAPRISAPLAPMAPPSVGVATPMKIVPSTRKIRNSGGTITKVVCCAMCDRKRKPVNLAMIQLTTATQKANKIPKNMVSTTKSAPCVSESRIMSQPKTRAGDRQHCKGDQAAAAVGFAKSDSFQRQARRRLREYDGDQEDIDGVKARQHEARDEGALVHVADRAAELVGHDDEHERGRNDLRQRAGGRDDAGGDAPVIAVAQHDRQRDQPHGNDRGRNHAGGGREQRADEDHRIGEAAAHGAEQLADGVEQILRHAGAFEHQAHEGEERDRQQRVVAHHAVDAVGQRLQEIGDEQAELDADQAEDQADRAERERRRIAEQQEDHQAPEHDRSHVFDENGFHARPRMPLRKTSDLPSLR